MVRHRSRLASRWFAANSITIDSGATTTVAGEFSAELLISGTYGTYVDNGTIDVMAGTSLMLNGAFAGSGTINIGNGAELTIEGAAATSTGTITFEGSGDALTLYSCALNGSHAFTPTIGGLTASDVIDFVGSVTGATFNGANGGLLTLYNSAAVVAMLTFGGDYSGNSFQLPRSVAERKSSILLP